MGKGWISITGSQQRTKGKKDTSVPELYRGQLVHKAKHVFPMWCVATVATKPHNGKSLKPSRSRVSDGQTVRSKTERNKTGKTTRKGTGEVCSSVGRTKMPTERTNDKSYHHLCGLVTQVSSIYSSPCPSCSLGLILGWQRQLAIVSVCGRGCDSNKKQLLTLQSLHLPTEKPFSLKETPTKASESQ